MIQRVVLDANVWISAALKPESIPGNVVNLARDRLVQSVLSDALIDQILRHLERLGFPAADVARFAVVMREASEVVSPTAAIDVIVEQPSDNRMLECAVTGRVDVIVTGNRKHLLPLREYQGIPIVSSAASLAAWIRDAH